MRTVLLISYTFPPQYDVSARRAAKLCKYLPAAGWRPIVLTKDWTRPTLEDRRAYAVTHEAAALAELTGVTVVRAPYRTHDHPLRRLHRRLGGVYHPDDDSRAEPGDRSAGPVRAPRRGVGAVLTRRALSLAAPTFGDFPDAFRGWVPGAVSAGVELVRQERIDAIVSLCPPATAHVVASEIARETGTPWVAQFDDLYSFHLERQRPAWRAYADRRHRQWMRRASRVGAITPAMLEYLRRTYGVGGEVVMVGYDPADAALHREVGVDESARGHVLRIAYTGSIYPGDQRPEVFFAGLERALTSAGGHEDVPVRVTFAGTGRDDELARILDAFPRARAACELVGRVPPADAIRLQRRADALLLLNCTAPSPDEGTLSFPAKAFEYLHARRPILAVPRDPGGWGDQLIETSHAGITADTPSEVSDVLASWRAAIRTTGTIPFDGEPGDLEQYGLPRQAATLARLLDTAVGVATA